MFWKHVFILMISIPPPKMLLFRDLSIFPLYFTTPKWFALWSDPAFHVTVSLNCVPVLNKELFMKIVTMSTGNLKAIYPPDCDTSLQVDKEHCSAFSQQSRYKPAIRIWCEDNNTSNQYSVFFLPLWCVEIPKNLSSFLFMKWTT